jgi:Polyketide cyclase / dehydrase and lipid transport
VDTTLYQHSETVTVAASPEAAYDLVADITRMGEWSPVCTAGEWDDGGHSWFTGTNTTPERTWQTKCRVDVAEPGKEFTFVNCGMEGDVELVRWSYTFAGKPAGTEVTESWQVLSGYEGFMHRFVPDMDVAGYLDGVKPVTQQGMAETLAKLKASAEA